MDTETLLGIKELWGISWVAAHLQGSLPSWITSETIRKRVSPSYDKWSLPNPANEELFVARDPTEPFFVMQPDIVVEVEMRTIAINIGSAMDGIYRVGLGAVIQYTATEGILLYWVDRSDYD